MKPAPGNIAEFVMDLRWTDQHLCTTLITLTLLAICLTGCGGKTGTSASSPTSTRPLTADQVLTNMLAAYRQAISYTDQGVLRTSYRHNGVVADSTQEFAVRYVRPNKLHVMAYDIELASDGQSIRYKVLDDQTGNMDNQFVCRTVPQALCLSELFDADPILYHFVSKTAGHPIQMELLLAENPLGAFLEEGIQRQLIDNDEFEGRTCYRIEVTTSEGKFLLWIDHQDYVLRRFDFPAVGFLPQLAEAEAVSDVQLVAEFHGAQLNSTTDEDFELALPEKAKQVKYFVSLPPQLPTDMYGRRPDPFHFADLDGRKVTQRMLDQHVGVLVWFNNHPASEANLKLLQTVYDTYRQDQRVKFYALCTEPTTGSSNQQIGELLQRWQVDVPAARDLEPFGERLFGITQLPSLVVLDQRGRVQYFEILYEPSLARDLPAVIERLLAGDDVAAEILEQYRQFIAVYQRDLSIAGAQQSTADAAVSDASSPPPTQPQHLQLTQRWSCDQLKAPGNIFVLSEVSRSSGQTKGEHRLPRVLVHDGWRTICELNDRGDVVHRHQLDLPERAGVTYMRSAADQQGRRWYAAAEILGRQVYLFNDQWQRVISYPPADQKHGGIRDMQVYDLNGDDEPELYVGFWELLGVHQVSLEGESLARNRILPKILSLAATARDPDTLYRRLLATDDRGSIIAMNHYLRHDSPRSVSGHNINHLFASEFPPGPSAVLCGLSYADGATMLAIGLSEDYDVVWTYNLPAGTFGQQTQFVTSGRLLDEGAGQWIFARPDGSIHIISDDGQFQDTFQYGHVPTGIAATQFGEDRVLLISTANSVTAWSVHAK